ncbi:MAG: two-component system CheB/CheR fusion protein [Motiliproteus sp.]|jgi:two-component system CheB/CheR fusion protein
MTDQPHTHSKRASAPRAADKQAFGDKERFMVVGVGTSAGGLEALSTFLSAFPVDCGLAFILVPHLDPNQKSLMVELLAKQTAMPISEVTEGCLIEVNHVYVVPPRCSLTVVNGHLHLTASDISAPGRTGIDGFLHSLADDLQERAAGVVLSGTGSHGSRGIKQIKLKGGLTLAQASDTAGFEQMPLSALATGAIDFVLPPEQMADALMNYSVHVGFGNRVSGIIDEGEADAAFKRILDLLQSQSKLDYGQYRKTMILRRIYRRMGLGSITGLDEYLQRIQDKPAELSALNNDLLINVSAFFREPEAYAVLAKSVIPQLVQKSDLEHPVRIWVPGCSTGDEAWTLAMLLLEAFSAANKPPALQIFATDVDEEALQVGRRGIYPESIVLELSGERLQRFFVKQLDGSYKVKETLRNHIIFAPQNLLGDPPFSQLDLISCQNVLIYLELQVQRKIISLFHFGLKKTGFLMLGPSESIRGDTYLFSPISRKWRIFKRQGESPARLAELPRGIPITQRLPFFQKSLTASPEQSMTVLMHKQLLDHHTPASVLIDRHGEALRYHGQTSKYLEIPVGEPTKNLIAMARQGLRTRLRAAIHRALAERHEVIYNDARVARNGQYFPCRISVSPIEEKALDASLLLVTFADRHLPQVPLVADDALIDDSIIQQLEYELRLTRDELHSNIEALELSNEELKASNEEAMSMNEEMQSTNEELETSGEELRSVNEELTSSNSQLQLKIEELQRSSDDISNLLISSNIGSLFLDHQLCIKLFTPQIQPLLSLLDRDIGRPLADFSLKFNDSSLLADCSRVLDQLSTIEKEVMAASGRVYLRRIQPYRTQDNRIDGVVVTFIDVTQQLRADTEKRRLAQVLKDSNDAVIMQDLNGTIIAWNHGASVLYGYSETKALGASYRRMVPNDEVEQFEALSRSLCEGGGSLSVETRRQRQDGQYLHIWMTLGSVMDDVGQVVGIASTERDLSSFKRLEQELRKTNKTLERRVEERTKEFRVVVDKFSAMYRAAPVGLCTLDEALCLQSINDRLGLDLFPGQVVASLVGKTLANIAPELTRVLAPLVERVFLEAKPINGYELQLPEQKGQGHARTFLCYCQPIHKSTRVNVGVIVALQDITERKEIEQTLADKEERVTSILNTAVDAIISISNRGLIEAFNPAAEKMFGYTAEEALGGGVGLLIPSFKHGDSQAFVDHYDPLSRRTRVIGRTRELLARRKGGGDFPITLSVGMVENGHRYTGVIRDLSEQRALQNQLLSIAEQTQKDIGLALHDDIGQEMTGLTLKAETLALQLKLERQEPDAAALAYASNIIKSLDRTRKKIRILSHGLIPVAIDAKGLCQALEVLVRDAGESYSINCTFNAGPDTDIDAPEVATQLYQIVQEAVSNAVRHSQAQHIKVRLKQESRGLTLTVEDDGVGIADLSLSSGGSGLNIMQYRASMIHAQLSIVPNKSGGIKVICCLNNGEQHARKAKQSVGTHL